MAKSQKITVTAGTNGEHTLSAKDSDLFDILTTSLSTDTVVTGGHGLMQRGLFFVAGMALNNKMKTNSFNFLKDEKAKDDKKTVGYAG